MRLGIVRGHVTLTPAVPELLGLTLVVLEPVMMTNLVAKNGLAGGKALVAVDALGAAKGQMVAFTEGRVDAYCTLIVDSITTGNKQLQESEVSK
jgi:microcompartment protein CcmK/EutM